MIDFDRVSDVELLRQVAKIQDDEIRRLHNQVTGLVRQLAASKGKDAEEVERQLRLLQEQLEEGYRKTYGQGSERRPREEKPPKEREPQRGHGPTPQPELPLEEVIHPLDEADQVCPECGGRLDEWNDQFDDSEEIDVVEIQYVRKKHRRKKYKCSCCDHLETALGPQKLIPGGRYSLDFAIHSAIDKYSDHLPLERQTKRMNRAGLKISSQTLWDQIWALSCCYHAAIERLHRHLLSKDVVIADETRWPLLGVKDRKTKNWFVWALVAEDGVVYRIQDSRSNDAGKELLQDFGGVVVCDGYIVYESLSKNGEFTVANDWCHVRRHLIAAEASSPEEAGDLLDEIGELFKLEDEIEGQVADLAPIEANRLRAQVRDERSRKIVARFGEKVSGIKALRESPIAKAARYIENRWDGLKRFLDDPRVPITSNAAERSLRGPVLGRVNHFGSKSKRGTEVAAIFYSLIETAKLNGVEPHRYLREAALAHLRGETVPLPHELV